MHPLLGDLVPRPRSPRAAWDSPNPGTSSRRPRPHPLRPSPLQRPRGYPGRPRRGAQPPPQCSAAGAGDAGGRGNPGAGEPRLEGRGGGAGDVKWERSGAWGRGGSAEGGNQRERAELGRGGPSPRRPGGGACYSARRSARTRAAPVTRGVGPRLLLCPGLEPPPIREAGDGAGAAAASRPSFLHHPSPPRWTSGPPWAPHRLRKPSPPSSAAGPRATLSAEPPALFQTRLPPTPGPPLSIPSLPPSPSLERGRREGGVHPAPSPPPVIPPAWPARVGGAGGPGRHAGGAKGGSLCLSPCDPKSAGKMRLLLRPGGTW